MDLWTIYDSPHDFPGKFIARKYRIEHGTVNPTMQIFTSDSLNSVRDLIPGGLVRLRREADDDLVIVESWI